MVLLVRLYEVTSDCGGGAPPVNDTPGTQLAAGVEFACDLKSGAVRCWGSNALGQTGPVTLPEPAAEIAVGATTACARTVTGRVFCWGDNANQQLGAVEPPFTATPLEVVLPLPIAKLACIPTVASRWRATGACSAGATTAKAPWRAAMRTP